MKRLFLFLATILLIGCTTKSEPSPEAIKANKNKFISAMQKHLDAVSNQDLVALKETLAPNGQMWLMVPATERIDSVSGFMDYHKAWFAEPNWTFETKILETEISDDLGLAIVESIYREPLRDGVPYFNRMSISYVLKKINGNWYVIKDHASSIEKSTDNM